jgi:nitrite reductase/ring-hydroxylating ferredoxin subunit
MRRRHVSVATARTSVALYHRQVAASLERIWENVLDWEHLPWLHREAFRAIELQEGDSDGWSARVELAPSGASVQIEIELQRARRRYVTRTLQGPGAGSEIWTVLDPQDERTGIEVRFELAGVAAAHAAAVGGAYVRLYTQLWDQDEAMMARRQAWLDRAPARPDAAGATEPVALGPRAELRGRLPLRIEAFGRTWRVLELGGDLLVHAAHCPHAGGPLEDCTPDDVGRVTCPWHGYRFDLRAGAALDGRRLRLPRAPRLAEDADDVVWLLPPGGDTGS